MHIHFIQHVPFEGPASVGDWANDNNFTSSTTHVYQSTDFPPIEGIDMLVIMGGPMGVYEEDIYTWLKAEKAFIQTVIKAGKHVLGICLGAQLIAEVLGTVVKPHYQKEIGWFKVEKVNNHMLTNGLPAVFTTFHWHGDSFRLPKDATQLFRSEACEQQGFVLGKTVGIQFHMEVKKQALEVFTDHEKDELQKDDFVQTETEIIQQLDEFIPLQKQYMYSFLNNFIML